VMMISKTCSTLRFLTVDIPLYIRLSVYGNVCIVMYVLTNNERVCVCPIIANDRGK
jgi:hypothetical protein